jgi:hypothetical protein
MKTLLAGGLLGALLVAAGCYTPPPPAVAVQAPPPVVAPAPPPTGYVTYAPDYYVWDGNEYIGVSGGQYVYWSGATWAVAPPVIIGRFHGWERYHPEWRRHATPYRHGRGRYR